MVDTREVIKVVQLENERNSLQARIAHINDSYLWTDVEKDKLIKIYNEKLDAINCSLEIHNPWE